MRNKISRIFLLMSAAFLALGFYVAFEATNDCDLADTVLILALPGFIMLLAAAAITVGNEKISYRSGVWVFTAVLLCGFAFLGFERAQLIATAVGDCR